MLPQAAIPTFRRLKAAPFARCLAPAARPLPLGLGGGVTALSRCPFHQAALRMQTRTKPERVSRALALAALALKAGAGLLGGWLATAALWRGGSHGATYTAA